MTTERRNPCGSELARDGGESANEDVESDGLIASKLAPTGSFVRIDYHRHSMKTAKHEPEVLHCAFFWGSELARDGGESANEDVGSDGLIASKLAPTGSFVRIDYHRHSVKTAKHEPEVLHCAFVGASLLAKTAAHPTSM